MLGLIIIFWIGKYYYKLAEEYNKSKWGYAIIGVLSYYTGSFIAGVVIAIVAPSFIDTASSIALSLIALPLGLLAAYGLYKLLENNFKKNHVKVVDELENIGKSSE